MNQNKIITYSLLAYIRNNTDEQSIKSSLDIFIPLIKRVLSKLNNDNIHKVKIIEDDFPGEKSDLVKIFLGLKRPS